MKKKSRILPESYYPNAGSLRTPIDPARAATENDWKISRLAKRLISKIGLLYHMISTLMLSSASRL